jgi:hypothetical protein
MARIPFAHRLACRLVGMGLYLAAPKHDRPEWSRVNWLTTGLSAIRELNALGQQREIAKRHAKPSTRKRVL